MPPYVKARAWTFFSAALAEASRMIVAVGILGGAAWVILGPLLTTYITDTVKTQDFASRSEVIAVELKVNGRIANVEKQDAEQEADIDKLENDQNGIKNKLEHLDAQVNTIEDLAREQRTDIKDILKELRSP